MGQEWEEEVSPMVDLSWREYSEECQRCPNLNQSTEVSELNPFDCCRFLFLHMSHIFIKSILINLIDCWFIPLMEKSMKFDFIIELILKLRI